MKKRYRKQILKSLVGSKAHGLATAESDTDYRAVHVEPTSKLIEINYKPKGVLWVEGEKEDITSYELGTFINNVINCSPNELEVFVAPFVDWNMDGLDLLKLFPKVWHPEKVYEAFTNYANNKRKNMLNADNRKTVLKSGYNCLRVLYNLCDLLEKESFDIKVTDKDRIRLLKDIREGNWSTGQIIDLSYMLETQAKSLLKTCKHKPDLEYVNEFYLKLRKKYWEI